MKISKEKLERLRSAARRVRSGVSGALASGKGTAIGAGAGAAAGVGFSFLGQKFPILASRPWVEPGLLIVLGHFLKRKSLAAGHALVGAGGYRLGQLLITGNLFAYGVGDAGSYMPYAGSTNALEVGRVYSYENDSRQLYPQQASGVMGPYDGVGNAAGLVSDAMGM